MLETGEKQKVMVHIRWMIRRDMPEVLCIEKESFEFPWPEEGFISVLSQRNCIGMVTEREGEGQIVGFMIYGLNHARIHLLNFAVSAGYRRRGVGSKMIAGIINKLYYQRRTRVTLEVRETNLTAQLFFRANSFRAISTLRNRYEDTVEDAYLMQYRHEAEKTKNQLKKTLFKYGDATWSSPNGSLANAVAAT